MKKHLFSKYFTYLLLTCALGFVFLIGFLSLYTMDYFAAQQESRLEQASQNATRSVSTMMELTQQDFDYLLEEKRDLLLGVLEAQTSAEDDFFITDGQGKLIISHKGSIRAERLSTPVFAECKERAKEARSFSTDLGGALSEKKLCRVLLLEKTFPDGHKQSVGAIFLLTENLIGGYLNGLLKSFLAAGCLTLAMVLLSFYLMSRELVHPLRLLSEAAEAFAKGNFTHRLPEEEGGEMTPLLRAFNQMAQTLEENAKLRQTFVSTGKRRDPSRKAGTLLQDHSGRGSPPFPLGSDPSGNQSNDRRRTEVQFRSHGYLRAGADHPSVL